MRRRLIAKSLDAHPTNMTANRSVVPRGLEMACGLGLAIAGPVIIAVSLLDFDRVQTAPHPVAAAIINFAFIALAVFCIVVARRLLWPGARISLLSTAGWKVAGGAFVLVGVVTAIAAVWQAHAAMGLVTLILCTAVARWCLRASKDAVETSNSAGAADAAKTPRGTSMEGIRLGAIETGATKSESNTMISGRKLLHDEIKNIWAIDRSEVINAVYYLEKGALRLRPENHDLRGWPPGETEKYTPILEACDDRGGWLYGLFDDQHLIGAAVLESHFIGNNGDQLQLKFLHVSRPYRRQGWGQQLFALARVEAMRRGAKSLYISATPSEATIGFYLRLGCTVAAEPNPELFELEPEDIHFEYTLA